jgi:hypothetical protein
MDSPPPLTPHPHYTHADTNTPRENHQGARVAKIIAAPGAGVEEVVASPVKSGNWLLPALLACIASIIFNVLVFSQESIVREIRAISTQSIQAKIDEGKMPADQGKKAIEGIESMITPLTMTIFGSVSGVAMVFIEVFTIAGILWLVAITLLKSEVRYMKWVELTGLTMTVDALQKLIRGFLAVWKGTLLANPGPVLFVDSPALTRKHDLILSTLDLTDIWWLCLVALALATAGKVRPWKAILSVLGVWYAFRIGWICLTVPH